MQSRPNIVLVICDDLAYGDLGCHANPNAQTPALDAVARSGASLTRYCSGPLCTPARSALMTGRHPLRTGAIDTYLGRSMLHPDEVTVAEMLRFAGYRTGLFGKWHLGDCYPYRPMDRGFEETLTHRGGGLRQPNGPGTGSYFNPCLDRNGAPVPMEGYCTDIYFEEAINWIESIESGGDPFFLMVAPNAPHSPFEVPETLIERYRATGIPEIWARLYAMVENIDQNVARLLGCIDSKGISKETIFVFTSDHGPCGSACDEEGNIRYNSGLRGMKGSFYEGGIRVPCLWKWDKRIPPGSQIGQLANAVDIFPTLLEVAGVPVQQASNPVDGISLLPWLTGKTAEDSLQDRQICMQWHRGNKPEKGRNAAVMTNRYKWILHTADTPPELYDLLNDPEEANDISMDEPEISRNFAESYSDWFDDVCADPGRYQPFPIIVGSDASPDVLLTPQDWRLEDAAEDPSWSVVHPGNWYLRVLSTGPWNLLLELPVEAAGSPVQIRLGDWTHVVPTTPGLKNLEMLPSFSICLSSVTLPVGEASLEVRWGDGEGSNRGGPYYVRLSKAVPPSGFLSSDT